jgi:putative SOS response-associated peptidase YedK
MCNLYSLTSSQQAIRDLARAMRDSTGNLPLLPGIFPDYQAPVVRNTPEGREMAMARWGTPSPLFALQGKKTDPGVTNVRNAKSPTGVAGLAWKPLRRALHQLLRERGPAGRIAPQSLVRLR